MSPQTPLSRAVCVRVPYLIVTVAVVSLFTLEVPQHHYPTFKTNQKLQHKETTCGHDQTTHSLTYSRLKYTRVVIGQPVCMLCIGQFGRLGLEAEGSIPCLRPLGCH